jgi:hypothetical protein
MYDLTFLGLGPSTSLIKKIEILSWGKTVVIDCLYDPDDLLAYQMVFYDCCEIKWKLTFPEESEELEADIIDVRIGEKDYIKPAFFFTDIFELTICYGHLEIKKNW